MGDLAQGSVAELAALLSDARELGLGPALAAPLETLYDVPGLGQAGAALLDEISDVKSSPTIGDLAGDPAVVGILVAAPVNARVEVLGATARHMSAAAFEADKKVDIEVWARERQVTAWLDARPNVLEASIPWEDRKWLWRMVRGGPIRRLFGPDPGINVPAKTLERLRSAARAFLQVQAERVRAALAEEKERLSRPLPQAPAALALRARLLELRARIRAEALPRASGESGSRRKHSFSPDPPVWHFVEEEWPHQSRVELLLAERLPGEPVTATCSTDPAARCSHVLAAIDALLDILDEEGAESEAILAELGRPAWVRALGEIDARLAPETREATTRIGWRVARTRDGLSIEAVVQKATRSGGFSKGSRISLVELGRSPALADALPADREAVRILRVGELTGLHRRGGFAARALLALVGHPNVMLAAPTFKHLTVRTGTLGLAVLEREDGALLSPTVDGEPTSAQLLVDAYDDLDHLSWLIDEDAGVCKVVKAPAQALAVVDIIARRGGFFPPEAVPALLERLPALGERAGVTLPPSLRGDEVPADPRPLIRLEALGQGALRVSVLARPLADGPALVPGEGPDEVVAARPAGRVHARRGVRDEADRIRDRIGVLPLVDSAETEPFVWMLTEAEPALDLLAAIDAHRDMFSVEWGSEPRRVTRPATGSDLRIRIDDKRDWFGLSGQVEVDGASVPLGAVLEAIRGRQRYVHVDGDVWLRIGDELRARLAPASDHVEHGRGGLELSPMAAPALADLVGVDDEAPRRFHELVGKIRAAEHHEPRVPEELRGVLRDYQVTGFQWLSRLASWGVGACLADDMGVGKTIQALALLRERADKGPALVLAPTSVAWNWIREARRFTPSLQPILYHEVDRAETLERLGPGDVLVVSYGLLVRHAEELAQITFGTLILDEAQAIKNPATQRARAAGALQADFRVALTGTPVENRLAELWSLFRIIVPGLLGSWDRFRGRYASPIERERDPERQAALARLVRPFILRRVKGEVARELPARTEIRQEIELSPAERDLYEQVRHAVIAELGRPAPPEGAHHRRFQVLAALTRLRQLACHPRLVDPTSKIPSAKLERCMELIDELREGGHRALVFSQFTSHLALVREALAEAEIPFLYLDGATPPARRRELCDAFQRGEADVFLVSLKAGGTGLNLTAADYVIHLDPWWNPSVEDQATDRAHRIGQDRPVTVYRLVARETVEESILALHADKRSLVAGILEGADASPTLSTEDLLALLRERP